MNIAKPLVSVIIPVYNGGSFIADAVISVLSQEVQSLEVIIINDCSTDKTLDELKAFGDKVSILTNERNSGASFSRNRGIKHASGQYITFLDADDIWLENKLSRQISLMLQHQECEFLYGDSILVDSEQYQASKFKNLDTQNANFVFKNLVDVFENPYFSTSTIILTKKLCEQIGFFREDLKTAEDIDFCLKAASHTNIIKINTTLSITRRTKNSLSGAKGSYTDNLRVIDSFLMRHLNFTQQHPQKIRKVRRRIYNDWLNELVYRRESLEAIHVFFESLKKCLPNIYTYKLLFKALILIPFELKRRYYRATLVYLSLL